MTRRHYVLEELRNRRVDIDELAEIVSIQADRLFPNRTTASMFMKLFSEIGELVDDLDSASELADVFIMLLDHAHRHKIPLVESIIDKMIINEDRKWFQSELGVMRHVK